MYLYVEFADVWSTYEEAMMGFHTTNSNRRIKKIRLTEEQIKELQPELVGRNCGKDIFEKVSPLCIQEN